jgi:hypothetical protein
VWTRHLLRSAGGSPHNLITFWFPRAVAEGTPLAAPASITEGSLAWLEKTHGPLEHEAELWPRMPTGEEARVLAITAGPVQIVWRRSRHRHSAAPVVASMAVYPADRTRLRRVDR